MYIYWNIDSWIININIVPMDSVIFHHFIISEINLRKFIQPFTKILLIHVDIATIEIISIKNDMLERVFVKICDDW